MNEADIEAWVKANPDAAEKLIWRHKKKRLSPEVLGAMQQKEYSISDSTPSMQRALFDIAKLLNASGLELKSIIQKVLHVTLQLVPAEKCSLFLLDKTKNELYDIAFDLNSHSDGKKGEKHITMPVGMGIAGNVALTKVGRNIKDAYSEPLFNRDVDQKTGFRTKTMLCLPILGHVVHGGPIELVGVASIINKKSRNSDEGFTEEDVLIFKDLLVLVGNAIANAKIFEQTKQLAATNAALFKKAEMESKKSRILLEVSKITSRAMGIETLIKDILTCAKQFVHAQVSSLFLVDHKKMELYSSVFEGDGTQQKISFSMSQGVAGSVATAGKTANIKNAYEDSRFNSAFDKKNNFKTVSMLSVPIFGPENIIVGVANLINKLDEEGQVTVFSDSDQELFEDIAVFCGIALHKTILLDEIKNQKQRLTIVMELISYHARSKPEDVEAFEACEKKFLARQDPISSILYDPHQFLNTDDSLAALAHQFFNTLSYKKMFEIPDAKMIDYLLTVRRNYRPVAYHNFTHAVSVTHGLYTLIVNSALDTYFSKLELFSMLVACLNHDIDHRGTNNAFQQKTHSVLASFYSTSTMERHHINHCMMILNSNDGALNILENMTTVDYKKSLDWIENSILATDLSLFFGTKKRVSEIMMTGGFVASNPEHVFLLRGVVMTCCDMSAMYKSFDNARHTANHVYEEFFQQGDEEVRLGMPFTSELTDRTKTKDIPRMQVGFYEFVVIPAFETLHKLLGDTVKPLLDNCIKNKAEWELLKKSGTAYSFNFN